MATVIINPTNNPNGTGSDNDREQERARRSAIKFIRHLHGLGGKGTNGVKDIVLEYHNDLQGNWKNADTSKRYLGVVIKYKGVALLQCALFKGDLECDEVIHYSSQEAPAELKPIKDDLHTYANTLLDDGTDRSVKEWMEEICKHFNEAQDLYFNCTTYSSMNKWGKIYTNVVLGLSTTKPAEA